MPGRNLRSTRKGKDVNKDWAKLNEGSPLPVDVEDRDIVPATTKKMNKKQKKAAAKKQKSQNKNKFLPTENVTSGDESYDGDLLLKNVNISPVMSEKCDQSGSGSSDDPDGDAVLRKAEKKLKELRKKEERSRREEKLLKIEKETKRLKKSLKDGKSRTKQRQLTTTADLRSMGDVVAKVDKLMDDKKLNFKDSSSSSSDSESPSSTNSSDSSSGKTSDVEKWEKKKEKVEEKKKKKKKSGKESKLTSNVKFPQTWPHSTLKFHFVGKEKKYDELSLAEFCAGYMSILKISKSSQKKARIEHLEELMYLATHKPWKSVLNYHAACLLEIERGNLKWGDNFQLHGLHSTILNGVGTTFNAHKQGNFSNNKQSSFTNSTGGDERVLFCKGYQRGNCTFNRDHYGYFMGENRLLRHICALCWQTLRKQSPHSELSETCPCKSEL